MLCFENQKGKKGKMCVSWHFNDVTFNVCFQVSLFSASIGDWCDGLLGHKVD